MLNTCPPSAWVAMRRMALRQHRSVPNEFVNTISRSTSGSDSARFSYTYPFAPALLIQMSTPPMLSDAKSVNASTASGREVVGGDDGDAVAEIFAQRGDRLAHAGLVARRDDDSVAAREEPARQLEAEAFGGTRDDHLERIGARGGNAGARSGSGGRRGSPRAADAEGRREGKRAGRRARRGAHRETRVACGTERANSLGRYRVIIWRGGRAEDEGREDRINLGGTASWRRNRARASSAAFLRFVRFRALPSDSLARPPLPAPRRSHRRALALRRRRPSVAGASCPATTSPPPP